MENNQQPIKIVIAAGIWPPDIGGPATYASNLARELATRGHEIKVITYGDDSYTENTENTSLRPSTSSGLQHGKAKTQKTLIVKVSRKYPLPLRYLIYTWRLYKLARKSDLIYAQGPVCSGLPTMIVSKLLRKPYVVKVTGDYAWEQAQQRFGVKELIEDFQSKKYSWQVELMRWIQKKVVKNARQVITPSRFLKKMVQKWGIAEDKIIVIYNSFKFKESGIRNQESRIDKKNVILTIGRLVPWKGFDTLIDLMPQLPPELKLIIIGDGPEKENLEKQIERLSLTNRVSLLGRLPHDQLINYLKQVKMFVLNASYEGLPHTILEVLACGVPVITTNVCGNPEVITDNVNGLLVEYNNKEQIKQAILKIYNNSELAERLVKQGHETLKCFGFDKMIEDTIIILSECYEFIS